MLRAHCVRPLRRFLVSAGLVAGSSAVIIVASTTAFAATPSIHAIVGAPVAAKPDFSYSAAMKAKGGVWDEAALLDKLGGKA